MRRHPAEAAAQSPAAAVTSAAFSAAAWTAARSAGLVARAQRAQRPLLRNRQRRRNRFQLQHVADEVAQRRDERRGLDRPAAISVAACAASCTCASVPSRITSDSAASTASRTRRARSEPPAAGMASGVAWRSSRRWRGSTASVPVNDPPSVLYAAISVFRRSLICRFSRSRRCCTVCITRSRTPTATTETSTRPSRVETRVCQELKSRALRMGSPAQRWASKGPGGRRDEGPTDARPPPLPSPACGPASRWRQAPRPAGSPCRRRRRS